MGSMRRSFANTGFVAISAGPCYSLALKEDGSIVGWGAKHPIHECNQVSDIPAGNDYVAIAAGGQHGLALVGPRGCLTCLGEFDDNNWVMMSDLFNMIGTVGLTGPPFIIPIGDPLWNDCGDMDSNGYMMMGDLFNLIALLGQAGPPYIIPCP